MGRGGGSGGGSRSSGGSHRSSRSSSSSGGHRVSRSYSSGRSSGGHSSRSSTHYHNHYHGGRSYGYRGSYHGGSGGSLTAVIATIVIFAVIFLIGSILSKPETTIVRTKIEDVAAYNNNNIIDETNEFNNASRTSARLKDFYSKTGVQPFIMWKAYDPSLKTDSEKESWARQWYDTNIETTNTFLLIYFEEEYDDGDGLLYYVNGAQSASIMDAEAVDIFWNYIDRYWWEDMSTDDMFVKVFDQTAKVIMCKPSNKWDVIRPIAIGGVLIIVGVIVVSVIRARAAKVKAEAEATERILNAPIKPLGEGATDAATEDAINKYNQ